MSEPFHIKHTLPPSFRAWYQLLRKIDSFLKAQPDTKTVVWFETHPNGLRQGYEFTPDEIKARALDEFLALVKDFDPQGQTYHYDIYSCVSVRFLDFIPYKPGDTA